MSVDYYFVCHECKKSIHVAQDGFSGFIFYSGESGCMKAFKNFLEEHSFHPKSICFAAEQDDCVEEYDEITW